MKRTLVIGGILLIGMLALSLGAAMYTGVGPFPGESSESITDFPTDDQIDDDSSGFVSSPETDAFSFTVDNVDECGTTCRDVAATLHNNQNVTATGVIVFIRIFAGEDNTDMGDLVWERKVEVGTLEAGGSYTTTERVELSIRDARKVERENGWITILTVVESDEKTVRFQESERVT